MKDILKTIKNRFSKLIAKKESYNRIGISPRKDWFLILVIMQATIVVLIGVAYYLYYLIEKEELFQSEHLSDAKSLTINEKLSKKTLIDIWTKEKSRIDFIEGPSVPADPSL